MGIAYKNMRRNPQKFGENKIIFPENLLQNRLVVGAQVENPYLASQVAYVFNNLVGLGFPEYEVVFFCRKKIDDLYKGAYRKGIVLT